MQKLALLLLLATSATRFAKPGNWDPSIRAFEAYERDNPPPEQPILFIGSSSTVFRQIRLFFGVFHFR